MSSADRLLTVLVVDDEKLLRWSLAEVLRRIGHTVIETGSAQDARRAIAQASDSIDVVLLDYRLPDSGDLRLLQDVRRCLPHAALIVMTAESTPELIEGALELGASCVLNKPFDLHEVDRIITKAFGPSRGR